MANVEYVFSATGADGVVSAFKSIGASADEQAKRGERAWGGAKKPLSDLEKLAKKVAADQERAASKAAAAQEKASQKAAAAAEKSAAAQSKAAEKGAQAQVKAAEKASAAQEKAATKASKAQQKEIDKTTAKQLAAFAKITASSKRAVDQMAKDQERAAASIAKSIQGSVLGAARQLGGAIFGVVSDKIGGALRQSFALQDSSRKLSIAGRRPGEAGTDPTTIRKSLENAALSAPGVESTEVASAVQSYTTKSRGDLQGGLQYAKLFAKFQSATGASGEQTGAAAAALKERFGVKSLDEMESALARLAAEAKTSGISIEEATSNFDRLSGAAKKFGLGEGLQGVRDVTALSSLARGSTGSGAKADVAVEALLKSLTNKASKLPDVIFKDGKMAPLTQSLPALIARVGGDNFTRKRMELSKKLGKGFDAVSPLLDTYQKTFESTGGSEQNKVAEASKAVREQLERLGSSTSDVAELNKDAATAQQSTSAKVQASWEELVKTVGADLMPKLGELIPQLAKLGTGALPPLIAALAMVTEGFVEMAKFLGLFTAKKETPEEREAKAKDALDKHSAELADKGLNATPEDIAKQKELEANYNKAYGETHEVIGDPNHHVANRSPEEVVSDAVAKLDSSDANAGREHKLLDKTNREMVMDVMAHPEHAEAYTQQYGQGDSRARALQDVADQSTYAKAKAAFDQSQKAAQGLTTAAGKISAAADKLNKGASVFPPH